jgi:hypothetical protein
VNIPSVGVALRDKYWKKLATLGKISLYDCLIHKNLRGAPEYALLATVAE